MRITKLQLAAAFVLTGTAVVAAKPASPPKPAVQVKPAPRPAAGVPTVSVPCAMDDLTLSATADAPVVCWETGCMELDVSDGTATAVAKPRAPKQWLGAVSEVKADSVCVGTTCKPFGKRVAAAIAAYRKEADADGPAITATTDLKAIAVPGSPPQIWSLKDDKPLKLKAPRSDTGEKPAAEAIQAAGKLFVVDWRACAGPCATMELVDSSGRNAGKGGSGGGVAFQLDAKRLVVVSETAVVQVFDLATGKSRGWMRFPGDPGLIGAVRIDDSTIAVLYGREDNADAKEVALVSVLGTNMIEVGSTMRLPRCGR